MFVHGLWLNGLESYFLRERVRQAGFAPVVFRYPSLHVTLGQVRQKLAACLRASKETAHIVAHSLGGLIALDTLENEVDLPPGRVVLLGSPVQGSRAATSIAKWSIGPQLLGPLALAELARARNCRWRTSREIGLIAGSRSVGLGRVFVDLPQPNDGTVCVDETRLPGATAELIVDASHLGMLLNRVVADAVGEFLTHGRFGK